MADTPAQNSPSAATPRPTMSITTGGAATGGSSSVIIAFLWNSFAVPKWGVPAMSVETAVAMGIVLTPIFSYILGWLPMPPVRNRRS